MKNQLIRLLNQAVDTILPARCVITGDMVEKQGQLAPGAWASLDFIAQPACKACGFPFDFEVEGANLCGPCMAQHPPYETARAVLKYTDASRSLILGFKHGDKTHAVRAFTPWLVRAGAEMLDDNPLLIPVPLHYWRLVSRRYNQSALMAWDLGKASGRQVLVDGLLRTRATPSQGHLKAKDRFKNVKKAFAMNPRHAEKIRGRSCILIDDVYTTGATVNECTRTLLNAGAAKVHVLTLARVVKGEF